MNGAYLQNCRGVLNLLMKSDVGQSLMKLFKNKIFANNMLLPKKNMKCFSSMYLLRNKVCLCGGTINCR